MLPRPPTSTLFPYTTLFRSESNRSFSAAEDLTEALYTRRVSAEIEAFFTTEDRKSTRLNSSHVAISYAVFCLKKKNGSRTEKAERDKAEGRGFGNRLMRRSC